MFYLIKFMERIITVMEKSALLGARVLANVLVCAGISEVGLSVGLYFGMYWDQ